MRAKKKLLTPDEVTKKYAMHWSQEQLREMQTTINALLAIAERKAKEKALLIASAPSGYDEKKMINGSGPYLYRRVRENGRNRSIYQGKVED